MNSMNKLMLLMSVALVSLSACSKSIDEPIAQTKNQNDAEQGTITLHIEGEREDIAVVDQDGRALNLKATINRNAQISKVTVEDSDEVPGIIYLFNDKGLKNPGSVNGLARQVKFKIRGNKVSFYGELATGRLQPGQLPFNKMTIVLGGSIKRQTIETGLADTRGGGVEYYAPRIAVRTEPGMDLSLLNPIFTSYAVDVHKGTKSGAADYYSTGHRFKLLGQFVSVHCRMVNGASVQARYNGFAVRGLGVMGIRLVAPERRADAGLTNRPIFESASPSFQSKEGEFIKFSDNKTYYIKGDGDAPYVDGKQTDAAYTLYVFPAMETGGIRMAYNNPRTSIFLTPPYDRVNRPNYWSKNKTTDESYQVKNTASGKFHNILLIVR